MGMIWKYRICIDTRSHIRQVFLQHAYNVCFWYQMDHITYLKTNIKHPSFLFIKKRVIW